MHTLWVQCLAKRLWTERAREPIPDIAISRSPQPQVPPTVVSVLLVLQYDPYLKARVANTVPELLLRKHCFKISFCSSCSTQSLHTYLCCTYLCHKELQVTHSIMTER